MKKLKEISFNEALERAKNLETVYAVDINAKDPKLMKLNTLTIGKVMTHDYIYQVIEEV